MATQSIILLAVAMPAAYPAGGFAPQATGIATASRMMLWVAIACFVGAVGLAGAAVWLMLA